MTVAGFLDQYFERYVVAESLRSIASIRSRVAALKDALGTLPVTALERTDTIEDFKRILVEPKNSLVRQYTALLGTEGIDIKFADEAIDSIARFAFSVNEQTEDIGARRLHTIMETLLDEYSFEGPDLEDKNVNIDAGYVHKQLAEIVKNEDLSRYIL